MVSEWREVKLAEILGKSGYIRGPFGSALRRGELSTSGVPVYEQQHAIYNERAFRYYINEEKYKELSRFTVKENDLIVSCSGTLGKISIIRKGDPKGIISQALLILRPDVEKALPKFLYYFLSSPLGYYSLGSVSSGSVQVNIAKRSIIEDITLRLPPLPEQHTIAHVLGTLDDKIELNHQMNQTLEAIAQALFKGWFADFEPFRDQGMQDSPLGKIPVGWKIEPLGKHFEVVRGLSHKGKYLSDNGMPLHNLNSVYEGGGYKYEGIKFYQGEYQDRHTVVPGDVIVTNTEQGFGFLLIGYPAIVPDCFGPVGLFSHHLFRLRVLDGSSLTTHYIYLLLKNRAYHDVVAGYTNGTTINMLQRGDISRLPIMIPSKEISARFDKLVAPLLSKIKQIHDESELLSSLRDTLLPRLLSGEIRVKDADKFIKEKIT